MDLGTTLLDFMNRNGVPGAILVFGGWFLVARIWPFITEKWWPDSVDRNKRQASILSELTSAVVELKTITAGMAGLLTEHRQTLTSIQLAIVGLVRERGSGSVALSDSDDRENDDEESRTLRSDPKADPVPAA